MQQIPSYARARGVPAAFGAASVVLALTILPDVATADVEGSPGHSCLFCGGGVHDPGGDGPAPSFRLGSRWSSTYLSGSGLSQGDPTVITWSIVPDGTDLASETPHSSLIAALDSAFGVTGGGSDLTTRNWFPIFSDSFDRWSQLAGLDYAYVTDDGVQHNGTNNGSATRGDVRIGGVDFGNSGTIAYNYFPDRGDMVIDTDDLPDVAGSGGFADPANAYRWGRNVIMHEHGHGMGIAHLDSSNGAFLMEPFINTSFDGPQFDDILSAQRHYGDVLEKGGGNDTAANAFHFGTLAINDSVSIGFDAGTTAVSSTAVSFVSIDDESDLDYYSFTIDAVTGITIDLTPMGPTYNEGPQNGTQTQFVTSALSDLTLSLFDTDGLTLLDFSNETGLGGSEQILMDLMAGTYFVQIAGLTQDRIQMYQLDLLASAPVPEPASMLLLCLGGGLLTMRRRAA